MAGYRVVKAKVPFKGGHVIDLFGDYDTLALSAYRTLDNDYESKIWQLLDSTGKAPAKMLNSQDVYEALFSLFMRAAEIERRTEASDIPQMTIPACSGTAG